MGACCVTKVKSLNIFDVDISKIERHTYAKQLKYCRFDNVYDGDTADIYFQDGSRTIRAPFRFFGYDSAEMKPLKSIPNREEVKHNAQEDKKFLESLILDKKLVVQFMDNEKFGRMMGNVWIVSDISYPEEMLVFHPELINQNSVSDLMIESGHGKSYFGGKKE